jgi:hypothetical protein
MNRDKLRSFGVPILAGTVVGMLMIWLMASALHAPAAHGIRVGLVAPAQAAAAIPASLEQKQPGAFSIVIYASADEARAAIDSRSVAGAVIVGGGTTQILVASADSEGSAAAIGAAFSAVAKATGSTPIVTDVRPLPASDPHGIVPFFLILAVSVSGLVFCGATFVLGDGRSIVRSLGSMAAFGVASGLLVTLTVGFVIGYGNNLWLLWVVVGLLALAVAAATIALQRLFGITGLGLSALFVILLGIATSGGLAGPPFLADGFRELTGILPPAAGLAAARDALYFEGGGLMTPIMVLVAWVSAAWAVTIAADLWRGRRAAAS